MRNAILPFPYTVVSLLNKLISLSFHVTNYHMPSQISANTALVLLFFMGARANICRILLFLIVGATKVFSQLAKLHLLPHATTIIAPTASGASHIHVLLCAHWLLRNQYILWLVFVWCRVYYSKYRTQIMEIDYEIDEFRLYELYYKWKIINMAEGQGLLTT